MATIFPLSASVGQIYQGYSYNGTAWEIIGEDWKPNTYSPTPPDYAEAGFIWIDSDEDIPEIDTASFVTASNYVVLTNKTINGSNNTLSNIPQNAITNLSTTLSTKQDVVSGVSNTEIGYLDGVTSGIQNQLDSKLSINSASTTYLSQASASTIYATKISPSITGTTSIQEILEYVLISTSAPAGIENYNVLTDHAVKIFTSDTTVGTSLNIRGDASTTLNSIMSIGQSLSIALIVKNGASGNYINEISIDGSFVNRTLLWQSGTAPTSGNSNSRDVYTFTIIKTANNTFIVLASQTKFA